MKLPIYENSMLSLTNSILEFFHVPHEFATLPLLDAELTKSYKHVVLCLVDGMGHYNMERVLPEDSFLRKHEISTLSSVYPSTTVAATTVACTGKTPAQTGWVGWHQYFKEYKSSYIMFLDYDYYHADAPKCPRNIEFDLMKYDSLWAQVERVGKSGQIVYPEFRTPGMQTFADQCKRIKEMCDDPKPGYIYWYWDELDANMHEYGCYDEITKKHFYYVNDELEKLAREINEDTLIIVTADHGHVDVEYMDMEEHPDLIECFDIYPTLEQRAMSFYIKPDMKDIFKEKFTAYYGEYYKLYTHDEVFATKLLGEGSEHPRIHEFVGDFLACALTPKTLRLQKSGPAKGNHAGLSDDEMTTPLIIIKKEM